MNSCTYEYTRQYIGETVTVHVLVPDGFEGEPETVPDALRRAKAALSDERRWRKDTDYSDLNGVDDPFCGSWAACARGALYLVTLGVFPRYHVGDEIDWSTPTVVDRRRTLLNDSMRTLASARPQEPCKACGNVHGTDDPDKVVVYNDTMSTTYEDVMAWFDKAIEGAEQLDPAATVEGGA